VRADDVNVAAVELIDGQGARASALCNRCFIRWPAEEELTRVFRAEAWPGWKVKRQAHWPSRQPPPRREHAAVVGAIQEALQQAVWDLFAKSTGSLVGIAGRTAPQCASLCQWARLPSERNGAFQSLFAAAAQQGFTAFKIKVGHPDVERDIHRLNLLKQVVGPGAKVMVDANEGWTARQTCATSGCFAAPATRYSG